LKDLENGDLPVALFERLLEDQREFKTGGGAESLWFCLITKNNNRIFHFSQFISSWRMAG